MKRIMLVLSAVFVAFGAATYWALAVPSGAAGNDDPVLNAANAADPAIIAGKPELLLYVPRPNGML